MFDEAFRARFAPPARPLARMLLRAGVTANHITIAAFVLAAAAAALVAHDSPRAGLAVWLVSRLGDGLDGVVAREGGLSTPFGGFLDITLDMAAYSVMVLGFAAHYPALTSAWAAVLAGYVVVITTTLALSDAARATARQVSTTDRTFQFTRGLTEAGETTVMYALWVLAPSHVWWLVWLWIAALLVTGIQRSYLAWRVLR
jgi:phosphatidylglycerophosphate synthase